MSLCSLCNQDAVIAYVDAYGINYCLGCAADKCQMLENEAKENART